MGRKKKYENAEIVKKILAREADAMGNIQFSVSLIFLDLKKKDDREYLKHHIEEMINLFNDALKELEEKKNESNDKHADEPVDKMKKS